MAMTRETLEESIAQAEQFIDACQNVLIDLNEELKWERGRKRETPEPPSGSDRVWAGTKNSGALRRISMDMTRTLAKLRKPYGYDSW